MNFIDAIKNALMRVFDYKTRSSRSEFWWFILLFALGLTLAMVGDSYFPVDSDENLTGIAALAVIVFWMIMPILYVVSLLIILTLSIRRFHDTDKSGWWLLIILAPLGFIIWFIMMGQKGTQGFNRFGEDPLGDGFDVFD